LRLENQLGQELQRAALGADYVGIGNNTSYDLLGTEFTPEYFNLEDASNSIRRHLLKQGVITVIDLSKITSMQAADVRQFVQSLSESEQTRIKFLEGK
jgi:hypothetical protein